MQLIRSSGPYYLDVLARMHAALAPERYLEIGSETGASLRLSNGRSIAVDPGFRLGHEVVGSKPETLLFQQTSDDFFASGFLRKLSWTVDFAFLDGMHQIEYLLRDFINTEAHATPDSVVAIHDILPWTENMTVRDRRHSKTPAWTGDVWKIIPILSELRPDLQLRVIDCVPTGLLVVEGLDPSSRVLPDRIDTIVETWRDKALSEFGIARFNAATSHRMPGALSFHRTVWPSMKARRNNLFFSIKHSTPNAKLCEHWGDHHFAVGLAKALKVLGHEAETATLDTWNAPRRPNQVDIQLRGQNPFTRSPDGPFIMWIIYPSGAPISEAEADEADHLFVASPLSAELWAKRLGSDRASYLPQCFDPDIMTVPAKTRRDGLLFVANNHDHRQGGVRPIVELANAAGARLEIWGHFWDGSKVEGQVRGKLIENARLGAAYGQAEAVLCDHLPLMRQRGFASNRIFDALACATPVITDPVATLPDGFAEFVHIVTTPEEFTAAVAALRAEKKAERARRVAFARKMVALHSFEQRAREIVLVAQRIIGGPEASGVRRGIRDAGTAGAENG